MVCRVAAGVLWLVGYVVEMAGLRKIGGGEQFDVRAGETLAGRVED